MEVIMEGGSMGSIDRNHGDTSAYVQQFFRGFYTAVNYYTDSLFARQVKAKIEGVGGQVNTEK